MQFTRVPFAALMLAFTRLHFSAYSQVTQAAEQSASGNCVQLRLRTETLHWCACRLKGYAGQALAFSLMKHETYWANTDRALVDQWQSGRAGRLSLIAAIQETLRGPDLRDFLECMDAVCEEPEPFKSKSLWVTLSRLFLFTVPRYRIK